jgi:hypothetical protein
MTDDQLMAKYSLSARGLERVFRKLLEAKLIKQFEFDWRPIEYDDTYFRSGVTRREEVRLFDSEPNSVLRKPSLSELPHVQLRSSQKTSGRHGVFAVELPK